MIADLDRTIEKLLNAEIPIKNGEIDIKFDQPKREWSARLSRPTINLFLYDIRENNVLRQHQWERVAQSNGRPPEHLAHRKRTPFRVDCHYMMTTWANDPQDEHRLMTRAMLALFRFPILFKDKLLGEMKEQPFDLQTRLASHDKLTNPAEVWGSLDNEIRPSVSYIVTLAMDPWAEITTPVVRTITMQTGQTATLPTQMQLTPSSDDATSTIGGLVRSGEKPQEGVQVALKGTGYLDTTDEQGQFSIGSVPHGEYALVVWPQAGKPKEKSISVPAESYDIEI